MKHKDVGTLEAITVEESVPCRNTGTIVGEVSASIRTTQMLENNEMKQNEVNLCPRW